MHVSYQHNFENEMSPVTNMKGLNVAHIHVYVQEHTSIYQAYLIALIFIIL